MNPPREAIGPLFSMGSVLVFLRKPIATCDFSVGSRHPVPPPPLDLPIMHGEECTFHGLAVTHLYHFNDLQTCQEFFFTLLKILPFYILTSFLFSSLIVRI